ncbi:MAG: PH domain-containing protein [Actinobacteria bacterium]|jgi:putative membrane protein|uniref:Unannotated protein n=1 Tax=freshwater metagenome TaxID=449393 RepID=A0A6J6ESL2_9ZZZZ|nr:PH domain-containing protein [Actinomycetota bacterium]
MSGTDTDAAGGGITDDVGGTADAGDAVPAVAFVAAPRRLHPASPVVDLAVWLPRMWPVLLIAVSRSWGPVALGAVAITILAARAVAWMRTSWSFDGRELTLSSGVWNRTVRSAPVERLQQVEVVRKLRHQALGVSSVRVQLADGGISSGDVVLEVLSVHDAEALRVELERARRTAVVGDVAAAVPPPPSHELLRLTPGLLALGGVTGASLLLLPAAAFAVLSVLDDVGLDDDAFDLVRGVSLVVGIAVVAAISIAGAALLTVVRHHQFRLSRRTTDLVVERGLFNRRTTTIPMARVQLVRLHRNLVRRRCGIASIDVITSGRQTLDGAGSTGDSVPVARWADALAVSSAALGERSVVQADRPTVPVAVARLVRRRMIVAAVLLGWIPFVASGWPEGPRGAVVVGVVVVLVGVVARATGRSRRHGIGDDVVVVEGGTLAWRRSLVPFDRVQSWSVSQSPFQRRHDLHDVAIHLAGHHAVTVKDATVEQRDALLEALRRREAVETAR